MMRKLTKRQAQFVELKAHGVGNRTAALCAGYAYTSVDQAASRLMAQERIKSAIRDAQRVGQR